MIQLVKVSLFNNMINIKTERLNIREMQLGDAPFILKLLNDPAFIKNIGDKKVRTITEANNYITTGPLESYQKNGYGLFLTELISGNKWIPLGMCGLIKRAELEDTDIGFAFLPEYTGKGFGYESASAVLEFGRTKIGLKRVVAIVSPENAGSIKLLKKLGFQYERMIRLFKEDSEIELYCKRFK